MDSQLTIRACGQVALSLNEVPLEKFRSKKATALLLYLACTGSTHSRELLADLLWDASTTKQSLSNLRTVLSMLRTQLDGFILTEQNHLGLSCQSQTSVDYLAIERRISEIPKTLDAHSADCLNQTLQSYQGGFLQNFAVDDAPRFTQWVRCRQRSLHDGVLTAYQKLTKFHCDNQDFTTGISTAHCWLQCDPIDESAHAFLIEMLAKSGRRKAALDQYNVCRELLREGLDVEPALGIQQLYREIRGAVC